MKPNVLVVVLDSVRAANCSLYGYNRETTPLLSQFAESATVYTQARSPSVGSRPSHASLFTGYHAAEHDLGSDDTLREGVTIWEKLRDEYEYSTGVFTSNPFFQSNDHGFLTGFDTAKTDAVDIYGLPFSDGVDPRTHLDISKIGMVKRCLKHGNPARSLFNIYSYYGFANNNRVVLPSLRIERSLPDSEYVREFLDWEEGQSGPWAACINLMNAHYPYHPREENQWGDETLLDLQRDWRESENNNMDAFHSGERPWWQLEAFEALYDGAIRSIDKLLDLLISTLQDRGQLEQTAVVITADHGEALSERSNHDPQLQLAGHGIEGGISDSKTHVPLICRSPGQSEGRTITDLSSLIYLPEYVMGSIEGEENERVFCTERAIVSFETEIDTRCFGVYKQEEDMITAYSAYGNSKTSWVVRAPQAKVETEDVDRELRRAQSSLEPAGVSSSREDELQFTAKNRLRDLGYID